MKFGRWTMFVAAGLLLILLFVPYHSGSIHIDLITGSVKTNDWLFRVHVNTKLQETALAKWLRCREPNFQERWRFMSEWDEYVLGTVRGCAPVVDDILFFSKPEVSEAFVSSSTDEELAEFIHVLRNGTQTERDQALRAASEKVLMYLAEQVRHPDI